MLVVAKEPLIRLEMYGEGISEVIAVLKKAIPSIEITPLEKLEEDEYVNIFETDWFKKTDTKKLPGIIIKTKRENKGLTQSELSSLTKISVSNISAIENGKRNIGLKTAKKLAKTLGLEIQEII